MGGAAGSGVVRNICQAGAGACEGVEVVAARWPRAGRVATTGSRQGIRRSPLETPMAAQPGSNVVGRLVNPRVFNSALQEAVVRISHAGSLSRAHARVLHLVGMIRGGW